MVVVVVAVVVVVVAAVDGGGGGGGGGEVWRRWWHLRKSDHAVPRSPQKVKAVREALIAYSLEERVVVER